MCWFHKWSKWEYYLLENKYYTKQDGKLSVTQKQPRQRRRCLKCGKVQDVPIRDRDD